MDAALDAKDRVIYRAYWSPKNERWAAVTASPGPRTMIRARMASDADFAAPWRRLLRHPLPSAAPDEFAYVVEEQDGELRITDID